MLLTCSIHLTFACLCLLQVYTTKQMAVWVVHAYPCIPNIEAALDVLAMKRQEPSKQAILASASISPMTSEWNKLAYNRMYNLLLPL